MPATRICLVRHGETAWNVEKRLQGQLDVPLNAVGEAQARATAQGLEGQRFAALYSSDLSRARQTAEAIAQVVNLPIHLQAQLRERQYGIFERLTYTEAEARYPSEYARLHARDPDFVIPQGESLRQMVQRVGSCLRSLVADHPGQQILLVAHGGVLDAIRRIVTGKPLDEPRDFQISNAALNWLEFHPQNGWKILAWDQRDHLETALDELPG